MMDDAILNAADDGVSEGELMTDAEKSVQPREIEAIEAADGGTLVKLVCGHTIWFSYTPDVFGRLHTAGVMYCAQCVNAYLDSIRPRRADGSPGEPGL